MTIKQTLTYREANQMTLNELTLAVTAFSSFEEFQTRMRAGYVPTLVVKPLPRSGGELSRQAKVNALAEKLTLAGFKVWTGQ